MIAATRGVPRRAAAARTARRRARRLGIRRLRAPSDGDPRDAARRPLVASGPAACGPIFEPRSATSCRRVFQEDFAARVRRVRRRRESSSRRCSARRCPRTERLSVDDLVRVLVGWRAGTRVTFRRRAGIVEAVAAEARDGRPRGRHVQRRVRRHPREAARGAPCDGRDRLRWTASASPRAAATSCRPRRSRPGRAAGAAHDVQRRRSRRLAGRRPQRRRAARRASRRRATPGVPVTVLGGGSNVVVADARSAAAWSCGCG